MFDKEFKMNIDEIEKYIIGKKIKDMSLEEIRNFIEAQGNTIILNHHIYEKNQKEIERLNKELKKYKYSADELNEIERLQNIIKEVREEVRIYEEQSKDGITNELDNYVFVQRLKNVLDKGDDDLSIK